MTSVTSRCQTAPLCTSQLSCSDSCLAVSKGFSMCPRVSAIPVSGPESQPCRTRSTTCSRGQMDGVELYNHCTLQ